MALNKYSSSRRFTNTTTLERDYEGYRGGNKAKEKREYSAYRAEKLAKEIAIDDLIPTASDMPEHGDLQGPNTRLMFDKNKGTGTMYRYGTQNEIRSKEPVTRGNIRGMMQRIQEDIDKNK
tara:strand:- start:77 stop:439 length:363 start_codon:yes stop_codon:yes gene_type:complete